MSKKVYIIEAKTYFGYKGEKGEWVPYVHIDLIDYGSVFEDKADAKVTLTAINYALCNHNITHVRYRIRKYKRCR